MKRQIIALAGKAGAGKDTVAEVLNELGGFIGYAFAARMKTMLATGIGLNMNSLSREQKEAPLDFLPGKPSPRQLAQTLGTEWGRAIHPDFWIALLARDIETDDWTDDPAVITDCRFPNEVAWVKRQGGVVWWIERDGIAPVRAHASENAIGPQDCDRTILNLGTLEDLAVTVQQAYAQLQAERRAA